MAELLSIGDRVEEGTYEVHSRFRRVVNLTDGSRLVSVVEPGVGTGPLNLVVTDLDPEGIARLDVGRSSVQLDTKRYAFRTRQTYDSGIVLTEVSSGTIEENVAILRELLVALAADKSLTFLLDESRLKFFRPGFERALAEHVTHCVRDVFSSDLLRGISRLKGAGFGLTPSGDDFICGLLVGMHILEQTQAVDLVGLRAAVYDAARSGSILTDTALSLARDGLVFEQLKDVVTALGCGSRTDVRRATVRLLAVGHTSGADLATGLCLTLEHGLRKMRHS